MKLADLRKLAIRQQFRIRFRLQSGLECVINEQGMAQVPELKSIPQFSIEEELKSAAQFILEPVVPANRKNPPKPRPVAPPQTSPLEQANSPELAHVAVPQLAAIGEVEDDARIWVVGGASRGHDECPGHAQGHGHDPTIGQIQQQALCPPSHPRDGGPADLRHELFRRLGMADRARPVHLRIGDLGTG